jgi:hypothetical protein
MANHVRRQIREAVATAVTGLATTGARVFQSRVYPAQTSELPCLLIYTRSEVSEPITIHAPKELQRRVQLEVVAIAKATADLDDTLDGICKEVEIALAEPVAGLAGLSKSIALVSTEFDLQGVAEKPAGSATMVYAVDYFTFENAPDVAQ